MGRIGGGCLLMRESARLPLCPRFNFVKYRYRYENKVKDYNFGSLIRTDARKEYAEANTIFGACSRLLLHDVPGHPPLICPVTRMQVY